MTEKTIARDYSIFRDRGGVLRIAGGCLPPDGWECLASGLTEDEARTRKILILTREGDHRSGASGEGFPAPSEPSG